MTHTTPVLWSSPGGTTRRFDVIAAVDRFVAQNRDRLRFSRRRRRWMIKTPDGWKPDDNIAVTRAARDVGCAMWPEFKAVVDAAKRDTRLAYDDSEGGA